jgi:hypothetical protein
MSDPASALHDQFPEFLARLPAGLDLDALALETKAIQRRREVVDGAGLLRIALARGPGGLSLRQTAAWASLRGIAELSNPGVKYRLNQATGFLAAVVERLLAAKVPGAELRWPGRSLRLADGTCVSQPGSTGTDWRIHGVFDLGRGGFAHLDLTNRHAGEALTRGGPQAGEIRIGDRNYARASVRRPFDLIGYLQDLPPGASAHEVHLSAAIGDPEPPLPVRLIVQRKPPAAADASRQALQRAAARKGKTLDPRSLVAAEFMLLVTSLPRSGYSAPAILAAYRLRWQIELAFKRLKSLLHIDRLPTRTERGSQSWLYAHLILALLCDDLSQDVLEASP